MVPFIADPASPWLLSTYSSKAAPPSLGRLMSRVPTSQNDPAPPEPANNNARPIPSPPPAPNSRFEARFGATRTPSVNAQVTISMDVLSHIRQASIS